MKLTNQLFSVLLILTFAIFLMSGKPTTNAAKQASKEFVKKLSEDVQLTDSQSVAIESYMSEFFTDVKVANDKTNKSEKKSAKNNLFTLKKNFIDSVLTIEQKALLEEKKELRRSQSLEKSK